jgi:hypothetical protein
MPSFPISGAFDGVTGLFSDYSGGSSRATSLTSSDLFNLLGHSPCCLIPPIQRSTFTFATNSSFNIQHLIAANSSVRVGLPSSRCDGPRSLSPPLPRDQWHVLPLGVVLSERVQVADGSESPPPPAGRCPRGVARPLRGTRESRRFAGFRPLAFDEANEVQCPEQARTWTALRVMGNSDQYSR